VREHEPELFSRICSYAEQVFEKERKAYEGLVGGVKKANLEGEGRQVLHVTYGPVLKRYGREIRRLLLLHEEEFYTKLERHFSFMMPTFQKINK
jgi:hypothetical protein